MNRFEKILVNLSLGDRDVPFIRVANLVADLACSQSVTFLYSKEPVFLVVKEKGTGKEFLETLLGLRSEGNLL